MADYVLSPDELLKLYKHYYLKTERIIELEVKLKIEKDNTESWRELWNVENKDYIKLKKDYIKIKKKHKKASAMIAELKAENKELSRAYADLSDRFVKQRARITELERELFFDRDYE